MTTFLIVDDHALLRSSLARMLNVRFPDAVIGEAADAEEAVRFLEKQPWDLLILDIGLPGRNGLEALDDAQRIRPQTPVLILTGFVEDALAIRSFEKGAKGFLGKCCSEEELTAAVHKLLGGGRYLTEALAETLAANLADHKAPAPHTEVKGRLFDVLLRLGKGDPVKAIAADMGLSIKTISTYRARLLERLHLKSTAAIVRYCLLHGLVQ